MRCLQIFRMLNSTSGISCYRAIHTDGVLFARRRTRNVPRNINYEPGLKHTEAAWAEDSDALEIQNEADLEDSAELMNFEKEYAIYEDERMRRKKLGNVITAKKFFKGPPNPSTLTCNERECIRYLHKTDPIQWNIKSLSESFPATPDAISKVLRAKYKLTEEGKRKMDMRVQKNWELLAEGKLQAAPEVLEHLKKFINRREVLLEQIKKADFYLPDVKEEVVWNNGEMSKILSHYEKAIEKLADKHESQELLSDGSRNLSRRVKKYANVCANSEMSEKLKEVIEKNKLVDRRTEFAFPKEFKEEKVLHNISANAKSDLSPAVKKSEDVSAMGKFVSKDVKKKYNSHDNTIEFTFPNELKKAICEVNARIEIEGSSSKMLKSEETSGVKESVKKNASHDRRTEFAFSKEFKKAVCEFNPRTEIDSALIKSEETSHVKESRNEIDFSDPERLRLEEEYYSNQVKDIENTAFWNKGMSSQDKALAESKKVPLGGPDISARGNICSSDVYPERIKIPKDKRGSGLTFRVRDCYYDDDGEFLYRVPGMVK